MWPALLLVPLKQGAIAAKSIEEPVQHEK